MIWRLRSYQRTLNEEGHVLLQTHDHDEGEETDDVDQTPAQTGDVRLIEERTGEEADGEDAETVITEVEEEQQGVALGQDAALLQDEGEEDDGDQEEGGALDEPGQEVAEGVHAHHLHVLKDRRMKKNVWLQLNRKLMIYILQWNTSCRRSSRSWTSFFTKFATKRTQLIMRTRGKAKVMLFR